MPFSGTKCPSGTLAPVAAFLVNVVSVLNACSSKIFPHVVQHVNPLLSLVSASTSLAHVAHHCRTMPDDDRDRDDYRSLARSIERCASPTRARARCRHRGRQNVWVHFFRWFRVDTRPTPCWRHTTTTTTTRTTRAGGGAPMMMMVMVGPRGKACGDTEDIATGVLAGRRAVTRGAVVRAKVSIAMVVRVWGRRWWRVMTRMGGARMGRMDRRSTRATIGAGRGAATMFTVNDGYDVNVLWVAR
mmetsp:Transcript_8518/g.28161  ORF Transcript_8518/g.28161 Transcript_8518/m.28161 type:complete len:244 (+) Transcript_8518:2104-2835(+)